MDFFIEYSFSHFLTKVRDNIVNHFIARFFITSDSHLRLPLHLLPGFYGPTNAHGP